MAGWQNAQSAAADRHGYVERRAEMFEKLFWDKMYSTYERGVFLWRYHYVW